MDQIERFIDWGMTRFRRFTVWDVGVFKFCLLSIGMLIGSYFAKPFKRLRPLLWAVAAASYIYVIWRLIFADEA